MTTPMTVRDWRGIKYQLDHCSTTELINLLAHAQHTHDQVANFLAEIQAELVQRGELVSDPFFAA